MKKNATQQQTRSPNIYPADNTAAGLMDKPGAGAGNDQDLAELVWKYFREEITEAIQESQQALTPANGRSTTGKSPKR